MLLQPILEGWRIYSHIFEICIARKSREQLALEREPVINTKCKLNSTVSYASLKRLISNPISLHWPRHSSVEDRGQVVGRRRHLVGRLDEAHVLQVLETD